MASTWHWAGWTEERVARLKELWLEGKSATEIVGILGGGLTRSAVCAKVSRLGLQRSAAAVAVTKAPRPVQPPPLVTGVQHPPSQRRAPTRPKEPETKGPALMVTLLELRSHMCKWPIGFPEPEQLFCGRRAPGEQPYCPDHTQAAQQRPSSRAPHTGRELARSLRRYL